MTELAVIIVAGGGGTRFGGGNKLLADMGGEAVIRRTLANLTTNVLDGNIIVVVPGKLLETFKTVIDNAGIAIVAGGETRRDSVANGLAALPEAAEIVAIHDAARPLADGELLRRCVEAVEPGIAAIAAHRVTDTVKRVGGDGMVVDTLNRDELWSIETPQVFTVNDIKSAYSRVAADDRRPYTDDAAVAEAAGIKVRVVENLTPNIKITRPGDIELALALAASLS